MAEDRNSIPTAIPISPLIAHAVHIPSSRGQEANSSARAGNVGEWQAESGSYSSTFVPRGVAYRGGQRLLEDLEGNFRHPALVQNGAYVLRRAGSEPRSEDRLVEVRERVRDEPSSPTRHPDSLRNGTFPQGPMPTAPQFK